MKLTFVTSSQEGPGFTKAIYRNATGELDTRNYFLQLKNVNSHVEEVNTVKEMCSSLQHYAEQGAAIVKGHYTQELNDQPRAGMVDRTALTDWICLDFDSVKFVGDSTTLLDNIGIHDVDHIMQYSATHGIKPALRGHIFIKLNMAVAEAPLKQWFKYLNLTNEFLRPNVRLLASGSALGWPLDISLAEMHRLIYIAPPIFEGGVDDPFRSDGPMADLERIQFVPGKNPEFDIRKALDVADFSVVAQLQEETIQRLRKEKGLRRRQTPRLKHDKRSNTFYMPNPDTAFVSGEKIERGFVYLNLNGGDSWGYYHPENNYEVIFNFKGEPAYRTEEFLPEYYTECTQRHRVATRQRLQEQEESGTVHFYFTEKRSGAYYKGTSNVEQGIRDLDPARSREQIADFCVQHSLPAPDFVPVVDTVFEPNDTFFYDRKNNKVNLYVPSDYKLNADPDKSEGFIPPTIRKVLKHMLGSSEEALTRFTNWIGWIWQTGTKPQTAWVLHGTTGTGKGVTMNKILSPLFGEGQAVEITAEPLGEKFNGYMRRAQVLMIDESDTDNHRNAEALAAKLRNWITEPTIIIREMNKNAYREPNHTGIILSSNKRNPAIIDFEDRRYNVAPRQEEKLLTVVTVEEIKATITEELQDFAHFLSAMEIDEDMVKVPWDNDSKNRMKETTTSTPEEVTLRLIQGDLDYFADLITTGVGGEKMSNFDATKSFNFHTLMGKILERTHKDEDDLSRTIEFPLFREDLYAIFQHAAGWTMSPAKFSKALSKFGIYLENVRRDGTRLRGLKVVWSYNNDTIDTLSSLLPDLPNGRMDRAQ